MSKISLILDSGAFSAWTKQTEIDIDKYISFCLEHLPYIDFIVNLDVIPGKYGQKDLPPEEIERSATVGWNNYEYMLKKGIPKEKLIHIFHQGENFRWLEKIANAMPYIGLSPANDRSTSEKMQWLDQCMKYVCDKDGMPIVKWHGFAVTSLKLMLRYPWYSVDSTSWVMTSRVGSIYVPRYKNGEWIYDEDSWKVTVSSRSPTKGEIGKHFDTLPENVKDRILEYLSMKGYKIGKSEFKMVSAKKYKLEENEKWFGKESPDGTREVEMIIEDGLCNNYKLRDEVNIIYFLDLEKSMPKWPWPYKSKGVQGFSL